MDVLLVPNELNSFGNFSYPVKLYEAMACRIPVVASATDPAKWILNGQKQFLAHPGDSAEMAQKIKSALEMDRIHYGRQNSWESSCAAFEAALIEFD
jgi:glycosyltransferase involved in cell wall biosynthesis